MPISGGGMLIVVTVYSAKEAVAAMIKRLAHRNANVQLYTLEVGSCSPASRKTVAPCGR